MESKNQGLLYLLYWDDVVSDLAFSERCPRKQFYEALNEITASSRYMKILKAAAWEDAILQNIEYNANISFDNEKKKSLMEGFASDDLGNAFVQALENPINEEDEVALRSTFEEDLVKSICDASMALCVEKDSIAAAKMPNDEGDNGIGEFTREMFFFEKIIRLIEDVPKEIDVTSKHIETGRQKVLACFFQAVKNELVNTKSCRPRNLPAHILKPTEVDVKDIGKKAKSYMRTEYGW